MASFSPSRAIGWSVLSAFAVALAVFLLRRPPPPPSEIEGKIVLKVWNIPRENPSSAGEAARRKMFEKFLEENPDVRVVPGGGLSLSGVGGEVPLMMAFAGGMAPDVIYIMQENMHAYMDQGFLAPLEEYAEKWEGKKRIHPAIRGHISRDGHLYAVPALYELMGLYYRLDLFKRAGLDPKKPPENWQELEEYSRKLTDPEKGQYGFAVPLGSWIFPNFIWQAGGDIARQMPDGTWRASLHEPESVRAFEFYKSLVWGKWERDGRTIAGVGRKYKHFGDMRQDWDNGKLGMMVYWWHDDEPRPIEPRLVGRAALPAGPDGTRASLLNTELYGINSTIKDKRKRDAAWRYIEFMCGEEARRIRTEVYVEWGMAKFVNPDDLEELGYSEYIDEFQKSWQKVNRMTFDIGKTQPNTPNFRGVQDILDEGLDRCMLAADTDVPAILKETSAALDSKIFLYAPEQDMARKRRIAFGVLVLLAVGGAVAGAWAVRAHMAAARAQPAGAYYERKSIGWHLMAWMFMGPALVSILVWSYYPLGRGCVMAFEDYYIVGESKFIGLDNFIRVLESDIFWKSLVNTLYYVSLSLGLGFFMPIILAVLLSEVPLGKMAYRVLYYLPAVTSGLVIMFLWKSFYEPGQTGLLNRILAVFGAEPQTWLEDPKLAMLCIIVPGIWAGAGPGSIIYLAALKNIPEETYEAADLDGAGMFAKFRHVTVPSLKALMIINFVGSFIGAFHAMQNIFVMTGGGPVRATHTLGIEIFFDAFLFLRFGFATAIGWILGFLLIGFTLWQLRILKHAEFRAAGGN